MAVVVPTYLVADLVAAVRTDSDLNRSQVYTDAQIAALLSDAGSSLYDVFTGANQHYNIATFDFTLAGGVGGNSVPLPLDFQQGHSVDVNPGTAQPYTLRYLPNWLDRNRLNAAPFAIWGPGGGPREYYFLGAPGTSGSLVVLPAMGAAGSFRLYYTPMWQALALPEPIDVENNAIALVPNTTMGILGGGTAFQLDSGPNVFLPSDVGNTLTITGATNSNNNGTFAITAYANPTQVSIAGTHTSETFPPTAHVTLNRQSNVSTGGVWTFFGTSATANPSISVRVGDVLNISGAVNAGNNGSFPITVAETGGITITTGGVAGLVAENFAPGQLTVTVQAAGTTATLPQYMNSWVLYLKTMACITIRNKRGQDVDSFIQRLAVDQARIEKILQERQEEPSQPPLTRNSGFTGGW